MNALLSVAGVSAGYGKKTVVHAVDLALGAGEILVVLGHNGAGKTSLLTAEVRINSCATGPPKCVLHSLQAPYHGDVTSRLSSIIPVWVVAIVGAVLVGLIATPAGTYRWLAIVLTVVVLLTFIIQLALPSKEGLVMRMAASIGGSVILLAVATAILAATGA